MYAYMKGKIDEITETGIILEVNNIGYNIFLSEDEKNMIEVNKDIKIYTYYEHREDYTRLFGFLDRNKLIFFKKLLCVSGVGAKMALAIIGSIDTQSLATAIATDDINTIKTAPGVGPKLAAKIILELKDKITNDELKQKKKIVKNKNVDEAIIAMKVLGYTDRDLSGCLDGIDLEGKTVQEIIKMFLKYLQK